MKVLVAIADEGLVEQLGEHSLEVIQVDSLEAGTTALREHEPAFALIAASLPFAHDLIVSIRSSYDGPDRDRLPVVLLDDRNGTAEPLLRCLPDDTVEASEGPEKLVDAAKAILLRRARQMRLFDQELILKVSTTSEGVDQAAGILEGLVGAAGYQEEEQVRINHTFREAVGNAAEHGNKNNPEATIHINWLRSSDRIAIVVRDEGDGHDTEAFLARADQVSPLEHTRSRRENEARPGGLGVFIMKETCDEIAFNTSGNSIFLMKYLPGRAP